MPSHPCSPHQRLRINRESLLTTWTLFVPDLWVWRQLPRDCENVFSGQTSTVHEVGALSDFDDIAVRIADVAAYLAVLRDRLREELRSSTFP